MLDIHCKNVSSLKRHNIKHTDKKGYDCDTCGKQFKMAGNLKCHKKLHVEEKSLQCTICDHKLSGIDSLKHTC